VTALVVLGLVMAFSFGYLRGQRAGIEQARILGQAAVFLERSRCRRDQLGALYGSEVIARPSAAGRN